MENIQRTFVIIGAGMAGAATAYHLTQLGATRVIILEQENIAGMHSSGRNAAMVRQVVSDKAIARLASQGADFLLHLPEDWPVETAYLKNGSLLLSQKEWAPEDDAAGRQLGARWKSLEEACEQVPVLKGSPAKGAVWCPSDGVIDIHGLLQGFLRSATLRGAELRFSSRLMSVVVSENKVHAVLTDSDEISCDVIINASGAWAGDIGRMAGASDIPLKPYRRHIFVTESCAWVQTGWPIVWDISHEVYFRPESGGLLLSPCDETWHQPGIPPTDSSALELLAEKVSRCFPELPDLPIQSSWAGLRTMTPDKRFVVGWDPLLEGFFWVAGLGGHGVTVSSAVGRLAARQILHQAPPEESSSFSPARFQG
jgi:D-arginine dehydrogenase